MCTLNVQHAGEVESKDEGGSDLQSAFVGVGCCMSLCVFVGVWALSYARRKVHTA